MIINPYVFGGGGNPGGPNVISLLHLDGTNGSTTITDVVGKVWTAHNGAAISTAQSVFGGASLRLGGSAGEFIDTPDHADWDFSNGEFELRGRFRTDSIGTVLGVLSKVDSGHSFSPWVLFQNLDKLTLFSASASNSAWDIASNIEFGTIAANTWHDWELSRTGNTIYLILDGVIGNTIGVAGSTFLSTSNGAVTLGTFGTSEFAGYQDEFRAKKGAGGHTSNYTPEVAPFPDS